MQKVREVLAPSAIGAVASVLIYKYILKDDLDIDIDFLGMSLPSYQVIGAVSLGGNILGEFVSDVLIPMIPKVNAIESVQEKVVPPLISGLTTFGLMRTLVSEYTYFYEATAVSAIGSAVGKYTYSMI